LVWNDLSKFGWHFDFVVATVSASLAWALLVGLLGLV